MRSQQKADLCEDFTEQYLLFSKVFLKGIIESHSTEQDLSVHKIQADIYAPIYAYDSLILCHSLHVLMNSTLPLSTHLRFYHSTTH